MICDNCKIERLSSDFINNQNFCYHCMYRIRVQKASGIRTREVRYCRTCGDEIIHEENQKKRQRTVYCSCECAAKGHKHQLNNHWTRKVHGT
jgi:hypothetical protein